MHRDAKGACLTTSNAWRMHAWPLANMDNVDTILCDGEKGF